jgi:hypothetical protein
LALGVKSMRAVGYDAQSTDEDDAGEVHALPSDDEQDIDSENAIPALARASEGMDTSHSLPSPAY